MTRDQAIAVLQMYEPQLRALGVKRVSLFGSVARDQGGTASDVDLAVRLDGRIRGLARLARLDLIETLMSEKLGCAVDVVEEPTAKRSTLRRELARDAVRAF
jgi:hypothetical protein